MGNDTHVSDVGRMVHEFTELFSCKVYHDEMNKLKNLVSLYVDECLNFNKNPALTFNIASVEEEGNL